MSEKKEMLFDLHPEIIRLLGEEFHASKPVNKFKKAIEGLPKEEWGRVAQEVFADYAVNLINAAFNLGNDERYLDRPYQVLKDYCNRPDIGKFPLMGQRFLEVVYLGINETMPELPLVQSNHANLIFAVDAEDCSIFKELSAKCSEHIINMLPCKYMCLSACSCLLDHIEVKDAEIVMESNAIEDGMCQFRMTRRGVLLPKQD